MSFVHLHVRSGYSLLNGTTKIKDLVKKANELGFHSLALTDENVLYGAIPFYEECRKYGIKPIIGMMAHVQLEGDEAYPLVLLAKNNIGYRHLLKISSAIQTKTKGGIPEKWLRHYCDGIIALTPGRSGQIETLLGQQQWEKALETAFAYKRLFGDDSFYIAVQRHGTEEWWQRELIALSSEAKVPLVATNDVYYLEKKDAFVHDCLLAIQQGTKLDEEGRIKLPSDEYYLKSTDEMAALFADSPLALENTEKIASQCHVDIVFGDMKLPKYPLPENENAHDYLQRLCLKGLHERIVSPSPVYLERLRYELEVIKQMNFSDYFLIVSDFMSFARKQGIITGPGRGSAAGSLVAYVLYITNVDPVAYGLLFERFLNPERVSMPDIDIDFPDERRDEVIQYVADKYGMQHVAQIITFGTFGARAAIRDVGKAMGIDTEEIEKITKHIPSKMGITLQEAYDQSPLLKEAVNGSPKWRKAFAVALQLEGLPRHTSTHAAGVVISDQPLSDVVPLQQGHGNIYLTQYPMDVLEQLGLLKMDFLGLRTLTFISNICKLIYQKTGETVDLQHIPLDDAKTYALLSRGETTGIFQLESEGMKNVLKQLRPSQFEDIVAVNALYRPGPMDFIPTYVKRKHGDEAVTYLHRDLQPILQMTYGVIIYQEQIMQIAAEMAGFSLGQADLLRRAISKKDKDILNKERERFVHGCIAKGYDEKMAYELYSLIVRFANYGFNRSHAVAYSIIAYQLAYLKTHYPLYFYAALLTSLIGDEEKIAYCVQEMKQKGIRLLPPSINQSYYSFSVENDAIRCSLAAIRHVGAQTVKAIIEERKRRPFSDLFDFCLRLSKKAVNRKAIESLVLAGGFDEFGIERATLRESIDVALEHADLMGPYIVEDGDNLINELSFKPKYVEAPALPLVEKLAREKEVLGMYLSTHPVSAYTGRFQAAGALRIADVRNENEGKKLRIGVYIVEERKVRTKKGEEMALLSVSDESGEIRAVAFPDIYARYHSLLKTGEVVLLEGKMEERKTNRQFIIKRVFPLAELREQALYIKISPDHIRYGKLSVLKEALKKYRGHVPVVLYYEKDKKTIKLSEEYHVNASNECLEELREIFGYSYVVLK
ncbi:DNA polymerase III subunit alpha [Anoxybacillus tepidamans]|uniref:DNA polymerase III subunit alpha n=1 Tax=Anoxybacteroides tepidamans TaxID=265948 RepID=UPI00048A3CA6|nr:DNA polymerase III subunit alpha [Anoxybacillus tepidamans]